MWRSLRYLLPLWIVALVIKRALGRRVDVVAAQGALPTLTETTNAPVPPPGPRRTLGVLSQGDFRSLFLLIVSLLHGNLFIALTERVISQVEGANGSIFWTTTMLYYVLFFRVIQSQLAAAMKYDSAWRVNPFDYVVVFLTAIFEYVLFTHDRFTWASEAFKLRLLLAFSLFGAASYVFTYLRTRDEVRQDERRTERLIQTLNTGFMVLACVLVLLAMLRSDLFSIIALNVSLSILLLCNIYISMRLTLKLVQAS